MYEMYLYFLIVKVRENIVKVRENSFNYLFEGNFWMIENQISLLSFSIFWFCKPQKTS